MLQIFFINIFPLVKYFLLRQCDGGGRGAVAIVLVWLLAAGGHVLDPALGGHGGWRLATVLGSLYSLHRRRVWSILATEECSPRPDLHWTTPHTAPLTNYNLAMWSGPGLLLLAEHAEI